MDNAAIADQFSLLAQLLDIHGENSFKAKSYSAAAFTIEKLAVPLKNTPPETWSSIRGIGASAAGKISEILETGGLGVLRDYLSRTPPGVLEMLQIKGIGPKKIHTIWKEMGIESIGELQYACQENRLTLYKGFGEKTQQNVLESIRFYQQSQGHFLYAQVEEVFPQINAYLGQLFTPEKVGVTGAYRRQDLTIEELEFVIGHEAGFIKPKLLSAHPPELLEENSDSLLYRLMNGLKLRLYTGEDNLAQRLFLRTGSAEFAAAFQNEFGKFLKQTGNDSPDDRILFDNAGIPFIPPYLREYPGILDRAKQAQLPVVIKPDDIKGIIHSHSTWSDGTHTLEEMAAACRKNGYSYLVISDHSQTAAYAGGLREDKVRAQQQLIDQLNRQLAPFRIFKSIESDILNDGNLDYTDELLKTFDLVIASVHSNLKMTEEKAMSRLLRAIENPHTRILGHMTGRLLLSRNGYPLDHRKIIDACAANKVAIEINAHPRRLDMDWQWIPHALEKGVLLSINPDAHAIEGFADTRYGVLAAQKGGLPKESNLSSFSLAEFEEWLRKR